ncbi:MAG: acyl-CoA dehydrogenase, partial [Paludibacter sp.]
VGAIGYRLNHIAGRGTVDTRPFQIFEGSNDILYAQIAESVVKSMKTAKETSLYVYLKGQELSTRAAEYLKELINFDIDLQMPQRKLVELGKIISRLVSMDLVLKMGDTGFRADLIDGAVSILKQEITSLTGFFAYEQKTLVIENYEEGGNWLNFIKA